MFREKLPPFPNLPRNNPDIDWLPTVHVVETHFLLENLGSIRAILRYTGKFQCRWALPMENIIAQYYFWVKYVGCLSMLLNLFCHWCPIAIRNLWDPWKCQIRLMFLHGAQFSCVWKSWDPILKVSSDVETNILEDDKRIQNYISRTWESGVKTRRQKTINNARILHLFFTCSVNWCNYI